MNAYGNAGPRRGLRARWGGCAVGAAFVAGGCGGESANPPVSSVGADAAAQGDAAGHADAAASHDAAVKAQDSGMQTIPRVDAAADGSIVDAATADATSGAVDAGTAPRDASPGDSASRVDRRPGATAPSRPPGPRASPRRRTAAAWGPRPAAGARVGDRDYSTSGSGATSGATNTERACVVTSVSRR
jgi:hypothetical protein